MLVTKREAKQASKKLLSVFLAVIMIMTSMSVCFGTFVTASAEDDVDYTQQLADKLKDGAYANTISLIAAGKLGGSGKARTVNISFANYINFKQAAELLRLFDGAMKETEAWAKAVAGGTDNKGLCTGSTTADVRTELNTALAQHQVAMTTQITNILNLIYTSEGITTHANAVKSTKQGDWSNTVTFTTTDYMGYLAQIGKAAAVESSIELGVKYVVKMSGETNYTESTTCGTDYYYHHLLWAASHNIDAPATSSTNTEARAKVDAHIAELNSFINLTYAQLLELANAGSIDNKLAEYNTAKSNMVTYVGSQSTYDALFADYATGIANFLASVDSAKAFQDYMPTVDLWNDFVDANPDYGVFQYDNFGAAGSATQVKLVEDFATFKAYRDYLLTGGSIYDYLVDYNYIDEAYYTNFYDNVVAYDLQASKDKADALYNTYKDNYADLEAEAQTIIYSELCGYINAIGTYSSQVVNSVYTSGSAYLVDLREALKCEINAAVLYFAENADKSFIDLSTAGLWDKINEAKGQDAALTALYNDVKANVGEARANELLSAIRASATDMIENLYKTLADRFTAEVNNAWDLYVEMGKPTALKVDSFLKLSAVMVSIEPAILTDLQAAGKAGYITQETIDRYNELMKVGGIYEIWNAYATTFGFPDYKQTQITYDPRQPMEGDEIKTGVDPVTEAEMNNLIAALDKIITSDLVGDLLGGLLNPDAEAGAEFNLGAMLTDLIKGMLFTDDFINTVVQMLYPLVLNEFDKVWAGLPQSIEYSGINVVVRYMKSLNNILDEGNFEIFPNLLADKLESLYPDGRYQANIETLRAAGDRIDSWESPLLVDYENGEKLNLSWGVTEQKAKLDAGEITQAQFDAFFYQAFEDATSGLLPLLTTLITNKAWTPNQCTEIATGTVNILVNITLNVALQLGSTPNHGYANMLVPIYEILGVPYTPVATIESAEHNSDVAYLLEQILAPIFTFLGKLGDKPVDTLLEVLPDLVYALAFRMAKPMLNMLQTKITYDASANLVGSVMADGAEVKIGDMLIGYEDDKMLKEDMFVGGLNSLLSFFGLNIPAIDQATLATLGELTTMDTGRLAWIYDNSKIGAGKAYTIKADKADVGYYLLSYVLNVVKDEAALTNLLGMFVTDEASLANIKGIIYETLNLDEISVGDAIAAIVELANQVEYPVDGYVWYAGENSTPDGMTSAAQIYLNPGNDWTKDKAEYLYNNLEGLLNAVFSMAGLEIESVEAALGGAINGLFTNKTVTALAKLLGKLDINALLAGDAEEGEEAALPIDINKLIKDELGIDLSVYAQYAELADDAEIDFGVTDAQSFADALASLLNPVKPLLDFILGGKDLTLIDSAITLQGYKGYDNAIIPLLEALGAAPAAYTDGADTLALTLNGLVGVINKLTTNDPAVEKDGAIYTIIDMLPGILYYLSSNALSQGVDKLLTPVYAILDTIRPIYDLDLAGLIAGIEIGEEGAKKPLGLDLKNLTWGTIFTLLNDLLGLDLSALAQVIYDVSKDIGATYTSVSTLESTWKKGAYGENFDQADMLTVVLSFVLEWATVPANAAKLDELLKTNGIIASLGSVFESVEITYDREPNWMYWFATEEEFEAYLAGDTALPNTLYALEYPDSNDWDEETAKYFAENIGIFVDIVIGMINKDKEDAPKTLAGLIDGLLAGYVNGKTLNDLVALISGFLGDIDENLINTAGYLLGVDLAGLMAYECKAEDMTVSEFINELANVLDTYAGGLINWLFFGDDYRFAKKSDNTDTIVINGGLGYEKGLAMILEALGCELPAEANTKSVLGALATRVEAILANPVNEVLDLLPNLIYFLNANGAGVAVDNLLKPVNALLTKLQAFGLNVNLTELIGIDLANLSLANVVTIVEDATGLTLDAAEEILVDFCTGKITKGTYIYKMEADREDVITILLTVALTLVLDETFAAQLDEMLGTDFIAQLKTVFAPDNIEYTVPNWDYPLAENGTVDAMKYSITYPNNWNKATADYVVSILPELGDMIAGLVDSNYDSLSALLKANVNVFTTETLESLLGLITELLGDIDERLLAVGVILDVDLAGLKNHKVTQGITTVDAFAEELATILTTYAEGVVEWLLLGRTFTFFVSDDDGKGTGLEGQDIITINGAHGYAEGLALLLEALGCENLPEATDETEAIVSGVLASLAALINKVLDNPVETVIELLPNLIYFLNTNGVAAVVDNTIAALTALLNKLAVFGVELNINELVNLKKLMGIEDTDAAISLDNLSMADLLEAVSYMVEGLDLTLVENVLVGFALGKVEEYDTVSNFCAPAKKMAYATDFDKSAMLTVLVNLVVLTIADENNAEFVKGLIGEEAYGLIETLCVKGVVPAAIQDFDWQFTDKADSDEVLSSMNTTELYNEKVYGPLYTEEMANEISDGFGEFVNNIIYLLGVQIDGENVNNLTDLINGLLNGSLYNSANVVAIRDALAGVLASVADLEVNGANVGKYIVEVLKKAEIADVAAVAAVAVPEFENDREMFVEYLCDVLEPLYPILKWVLSNEDIAFFVDLEMNDVIVLEGGEGYAYGIIPLLETLDCKNILAPADYYAAVEADGDVVLTSILNPLLDRVDEILNNDPAQQILDILPNLIYFINSNGLDTVVKNTLHAVYGLLSAIAPIAEIDLYELIGINLADINMTWLLDKLIEVIANATGYEFEAKDFDPLAELTVGKLVSYTSLNGKTAYKMTYAEASDDDATAAGSGDKAEMATVIMRLAVTFVMHENNAELILNLLKDNLGMSDKAAEYMAGVFEAIAAIPTETYLGMNQALAVLYYIYYGIDLGVGELAGGIKDLNAEWQKILKELSSSSDPGEITIGDFLNGFLNTYFEDIFTSDGLAPNGFIAFFQRIIEWFNNIIEWFKNLFN